MRDNNVPIVYRLGRHNISDSVFLYFLDPDALTAEYGFGIEEFSGLTARSSCNLPRLTEALDCREGRPGPDLGKCGLVDSTST
jgi:2,3-dihydroxy-p-cumate/2,3-dihydroxybenzoate 3,4-dioxygenase